MNEPTRYMVCGAIAGVLLALLLSWLAGFNFDTRGWPAFWTFVLSSVAAFAGGVFGDNLHEHIQWTRRRNQ